MKSVLRSLFYLSLPITALVTFKPVGKVKAQQILEDNTVGTQVTRDVEIKGIESDRIDGGTTRGENLFHSFEQFNVEQGRGAYFSNPEGINNIITRVRGGKLSNISGTLGVLGNANLFLINPAGIQFGPNARLDVGGSFLASTADSLLFDNGFEFSASNSQAPPLLTINTPMTPIGLQLRDNPGNINNQSTELEVPSGKTLALVGGNVNFDGGKITAPGAEIEIGGLTAAGTVGIGSDGSLSFPQDVARGDVSFSNEAGVDVLSGGGGSVTIDSRNLDMSEGSEIVVGIGEGLGDSDSRAGDISINATDTVTIDGTNPTYSITGIRNAVLENGTGSAGNITMNAGSVNAEGNAKIASATFGQGDSGNIIINAENDVRFSGFGSGIFSSVIQTAVGNGGDININVADGSFSLSDAAVLRASTLGEGNSGNIEINATDGILIDSSNLLAQARSSSVGDAGNINLTTSKGSISLNNDSAIVSSNSGTGFAGDITLNAADSIFLANRSNIIASTQSQGDAGNVTLRTENGNISLTDQSKISSTVDPGTDSATITRRNGGKVDITTKNLTLTGGSQLQTEVRSGQRGNAGDITIDASGDVSFSGFTNTEGNQGFFRSGIITRLGEEAEGKGGDINITAKNLSLADSAQIEASTSGRGNPGNVTLFVDDAISLANSSNIGSSIQAGGEGIAGDINIKGRSLTLMSGSQIGASVVRERNNLSAGKGKGGNIDIQTTDFVDISGTNSGGFPSALLTSAERGTIATSDQAAGNISVTTGDFRIAERGIVNASTANSGAGGSIAINAKTFTATDDSLVITSTFGRGDAGDITLNISDHVIITGSDQEVINGIFANTFSNSTGNGGSIFINSRQVTIKNGGTIAATSAGTGEAGQIKLDADNLTLDRGTIAAQSLVASGGDINLNIKDLLLLRRNSQISATAGIGQGAGDGGNIDINTDLLVGFPKENSDITANAFDGTGGKVNIQAESIFGIEPLSRAELEKLLNTTDPNLLDPSRLPSSDITAISQDNPSLSGQVSVTTPDVDPSEGLVELPENVIDPEEQLAQNPCKQGVGSQFVQVGRGGLPTKPNQNFNGSTVRVDLVNPVYSTTNSHNKANYHKKINSYKPSNSTAKRIVPARGWILNEKGEVVLTSYDPTDINAQRVSQTPTMCSGR